ncbi:MAG: tetratricopeptide repeat protein [Thermosynechococcaceae cyanobacterium MS004]|nr:tetratricopeptide repeat protein [Thermosynechococcaceae cyanobacterium MS004]
MRQTMNHPHRLNAAILGIGVALVQVLPAQSLTKVEVSKIAQGITVMIQSAQNPRNSGSGIIIKRDGETYTVLTSYHVVQNSPAYRVLTPDKKQHPIIQGSIQPLPGVDLALVQFKSAGAYSVAKIGDSAQSPSGSTSFVAGFPGTNEVGTEPEYYFTSGEIAANGSRPHKDGYTLAYSNQTLPGMSGGPVLNEQGEVIGIHGRGERADLLQNPRLRNDIAVLKTEFNYAIPINTFLALAPQVNKTLALRIPSPSVPSAPKADDFVLQADEKYNTGDLKGAIADLGQAIRLDPKSAVAYRNRGFVRNELGDKQGAIADYGQAIRVDPKNAVTYANRGNVRRALGDKQGAIADLDQAIRLDPKFAVAYNNRGFFRNELGDKQGAIADYDQAIRLNPKFAGTYANRGRLRYQLGDKQGAITDYDQAIRLDPKSAVAYANRGNVRRGLGDKQGAIADYDQAIRLDPKSAVAYRNRGFVRNQLGDKQGAIADYDQAIRLDPKSAVAYRYRGNARRALRDNLGAIADYDQAIRLDPTIAAVYNSRGNTRSELGDEQRAIADYDKAIRLDPKFAAAYNNRGLSRRTLRDNLGAIADYDQAIRLDPKIADAYNNRGFARRALGDKQGAIIDWQKAAALYKAQGNEALYRKVIELLQEINRP